MVPCIQCRIEPDFIPGFLCRIYGFLRKFLQRHRKDLILQQAESLVLQISNLFYPVKAFPVKATKEFQSAITLTKDGKTGDCKRIFGIMGLAVKAGNEITLTFDGEDEEAAYAAVTEFVKANL